MVDYHLVVVFCILAVISSYVNIVLFKLVGEIWKQSHYFNEVGWTKEHKQSDDRSGYLTQSELGVKTFPLRIIFHTFEIVNIVHQGSYSWFIHAMFKEPITKPNGAQYSIDGIKSWDSPRPGLKQGAAAHGTPALPAVAHRQLQV